MNNDTAGFTIIEVIMFLAISSLLLVGALIGLGSAVTNTRFNDTTDSTQSFFQRQYLEVATGKNVRDDNLRCSNTGSILMGGATTDAGTSNCVILGRLLQFDFNTGAGVVTSRYISSSIQDADGLSDVQAFTRYQARIASPGITQLVTAYELPWSGIIKKSQRVNSSNDTAVGTVRSIAIVRSPVSERMMVYGFETATPAAADFADSANLLSNNRSLEVCLQSDNGLFPKRAILEVGTGQGQDLFSMNRGTFPAQRCS